MNKYIEKFAALPDWAKYISVFLFVILLAAVMPAQKPETTIKAEEVPTETPIALGEACVVKTACFGGLTEEAFEQAIKSSSAKDPEGIQELAQAGLITTVQPGTRVRLLETGIFKRKVRLLDGADKGAAVYVPAEYVITEDEYTAP